LRIRCVALKAERSGSKPVQLYTSLYVGGTWKRGQCHAAFCTEPNVEAMSEGRMVGKFCPAHQAEQEDYERAAEGTHDLEPKGLVQRESEKVEDYGWQYEYVSTFPTGDTVKTIYGPLTTSQMKGRFDGNQIRPDWRVKFTGDGVSMDFVPIEELFAGRLSSAFAEDLTPQLHEILVGGAKALVQAPIYALAAPAAAATPPVAPAISALLTAGDYTSSHPAPSGSARMLGAPVLLRGGSAAGRAASATESPPRSEVSGGWHQEGGTLHGNVLKYYRSPKMWRKRHIAAVFSEFGDGRIGVRCYKSETRQSRCPRTNIKSRKKKSLSVSREWFSLWNGLQPVEPHLTPGGSFSSIPSSRAATAHNSRRRTRNGRRI
jgi:hypothetical protein